MDSTKERCLNPELLDGIFRLMLRHGIKALTMDLVAHSLKMSKRTLYEMFDSKFDMLRLALLQRQQESNETMKEEFRKSGNVLLSISKMFEEHLRFMNEANVDFFRDMDSYIKDMRDVQRAAIEHRGEIMDEFYRLGVEQGLLRDDVNMKMMQRILHLQFESLKRMEEIFESEFSLEEVCRTIFMSFMRGIATIKGLEILDEIWDNRNSHPRPNGYAEEKAIDRNCKKSFSA